MEDGVFEGVISRLSNLALIWPVVLNEISDDIRSPTSLLSCQKKLTKTYLPLVLSYFATVSVVQTPPPPPPPPALCIWTMYSLDLFLGCYTLESVH